MLWEKIAKNREFASLLFVTVFSITSLVWNGNFLVSGIAGFQRVGDFFSGSLDAFGGLFKGAYTKLESFEKVREERDSCLNVMEDYYKLNQELERLKSENSVLRRELTFVPRTDFPTVRAEILSVRLNTIYRTIIIDKGSSSGIQAYMPVVTRTLDDKGRFIEALVGKVIAVGTSTAVVQPIINSNFSMGVAIPGTSLWASLSGNSGKGTEAILEFIDSGIVIDPKVFGSFPMGPASAPGPHSTVMPEGYSKIGKAVYTSGGSGVFPEGIPVGIITEEGPREGSFKTAYLKPFVQFDKLEYVTILKKNPDRWIEEWPAERSIKIDNPYLGELNYPEDERKKEKALEKQKLNPNSNGATNTNGTTNSSGQNSTQGSKPNSGTTTKPATTSGTTKPVDKPENSSEPAPTPKVESGGDNP
ncbi:rod shape-determining protein MreC [Leptospira sp. GIMC2001]|uniref:rod shape-determining protein MreC n=1 Tax=Leptospira sp. GIMC2001 TaxID=1513297 RepID=UPI002349FE42|nr:rod shape-determining protein MreC [Leptospira sp. GIMC2001]WCL50164.1 rod shape-determining protein MreC [Leptospira sp. GIMC2001]